MKINHNRNYLIIALMAAIPFFFSYTPKKKERLFLPGKKNEWYIWLQKSGKNNDPKNVFHFEKNVLHVSGEEAGYITTIKQYRNFHLTLQFKWGEKRFPPRENAKRDGGVLYHANFYSGDKIWPRSLEYQIQEGDCGDFWMTDSTTIIFHDTLTLPRPSFRGTKFKDAEKPKGEWNKCEVIVKDGDITHIINGVIVNEAKLGNTKEGHILLQSEWAELYYKDVEVEELN